jgi:phosphoglycerate dehydrogenase-like enzyme
VLSSNTLLQYEPYCQSDVLSLHLRQSPDTAGFINTARGAINDQKALLKALEEKCIAGAGLDVCSQEPLPPNHPLTKIPNVVSMPHSGGITKEALEAGLQARHRKRLQLSRRHAAQRGDGAEGLSGNRRQSPS